MGGGGRGFTEYPARVWREFPGAPHLAFVLLLAFAGRGGLWLVLLTVATVGVVVAAGSGSWCTGIAAMVGPAVAVGPRSRPILSPPGPLGWPWSLGRCWFAGVAADPPRAGPRRSRWTLAVALAPAPRRPLLSWTRRSGGGKVGRFHLRRRAEELGADVVLLIGRGRRREQLARDALARGADVLGVAGATTPSPRGGGRRRARRAPAGHQRGTATTPPWTSGSTARTPPLPRGAARRWWRPGSTARATEAVRQQRLLRCLRRDRGEPRLPGRPAPDDAGSPARPARPASRRPPCRPAAAQLTVDAPTQCSSATTRTGTPTSTGGDGVPGSTAARSGWSPCPRGHGGRRWACSRAPRAGAWGGPRHGRLL